jgi:hypothetical protein
MHGSVRRSSECCHTNIAMSLRSTANIAVLTVARGAGSFNTTDRKRFTILGRLRHGMAPKRGNREAIHNRGVYVIKLPHAAGMPYGGLRCLGEAMATAATVSRSHSRLVPGTEFGGTRALSKCRACSRGWRKWYPAANIANIVMEWGQTPLASTPRAQWGGGAQNVLRNERSCGALTSITVPCPRYACNGRGRSLHLTILSTEPRGHRARSATARRDRKVADRRLVWQPRCLL